MIVSQRKGLRYVAAGVWVDDQARELFLLPAECRPGRGIEVMPEERVRQLVEGLYRATFNDPLSVGIEVDVVYGLGREEVDRGR